MKTAIPTPPVVGSLPQSQPHPHSHPYLGKSKAQIKQDLLRLNYASVEFVHWLLVLDLGLLLSFNKQICVQIEHYAQG